MKKSPTSKFISFVVITATLIVAGLLYEGKDALAQTGATVYFDIQPRGVIDVGNGISGTGFSVSPTLIVTIDRPTFDSYCSFDSYFQWTFYENLTGAPPLASGNQSLNTQSTYNIPFTVAIPTLPPNSYPIRSFYILLECPAGGNLTQSSNVDLIICNSSGNAGDPMCSSGGGGGGGPIQPGVGVTLGWGLVNPFAGNPQNVFDIIYLMTNWVLNIAGSLMVILIIYAGVRFMLSRGNPGDIQQAKNILKWALIGFAVILIGKGFIFIVDSVLRNQIPPIP